VCLLTGLLYGNNVNAILQDIRSINLGTVYESVVAQELHAHVFDLCGYHHEMPGEVAFLTADFDNLRALPIEVKSLYV
ncbi:MAG: ATPase, partial [Alphaproteobacteria bacterium]|nr:ATPase [Alphaproteobacteria bacterium]